MSLDVAKRPLGDKCPPSHWETLQTPKKGVCVQADLAESGKKWKRRPNPRGSQTK